MTGDFISWNQFFSPYVEMLNCCMEEGPFKLCDYWVFPSNSSPELIEDFGNHARFCYLEQGCMPRKEPLWKSCHLANPFFSRFKRRRTSFGHFLVDYVEAATSTNANPSVCWKG